MAVKPNLPAGKGQKYMGQIGKDQKFGKPFEGVDSGVMNLGGTHDDIGEKSGFQASTDDYIVKKGTAFGEAAKLNIMPPGMDINDQPMRDIRDMKLETYSGGVSFPSDGWSPEPRDLREDYKPKGSAN
jgi:hypothetical protein